VAISPAEARDGKHVTEPPACPAKFDDSLATSGIVGKDTEGVTPPKPTHTPEAEFSDEARRGIDRAGIKNFESVSLLGLVVDTTGKPQDLCIKKSAGYGLDIQAAKAVWKYRFKPATKDGHPVPMRLTVEVNFKRY
jgi:TonB family protein